MNTLLEQEVYSDETKTRLLAIMKRLGIDKKNDSRFVILRENRGQLALYSKLRGPVSSPTAAATGAAGSSSRPRRSTTPRPATPRRWCATSTPTCWASSNARGVALCCSSPRAPPLGRRCRLRRGHAHRRQPTSAASTYPASSPDAAIASAGCGATPTSAPIPASGCSAATARSTRIPRRPARWSGCWSITSRARATATRPPPTASAGCRRRRCAASLPTAAVGEGRSRRRRRRSQRLPRERRLETAAAGLRPAGRQHASHFMDDGHPPTAAAAPTTSSTISCLTRASGEDDCWRSLAQRRVGPNKTPSWKVYPEMKTVHHAASDHAALWCDLDV